MKICKPSEVRTPWILLIGWFYLISRHWCIWSNAAKPVHWHGLTRMQRQTDRQASREADSWSIGNPHPLLPGRRPCSCFTSSERLTQKFSSFKSLISLLGRLLLLCDCAVWLEYPIGDLPVSSGSLRRIITESATDYFCALFDPHSLTDCVDVDRLLSRFDSLFGSVLDEVAPLNLGNPPHKQPLFLAYWRCDQLQKNWMPLEKLSPWAPQTISSGPHHLFKQNARRG